MKATIPAHFIVSWKGDLNNYPPEFSIYVLNIKQGLRQDTSLALRAVSFVTEYEQSREGTHTHQHFMTKSS